MPVGESPAPHLRRLDGFALCDAQCERAFPRARYSVSSAAVSPLFAVASKLASFVPVTSCRADGAANPPGADASTVLYVLAIFILQRSPFLLTFTGPCFWPTSFPGHPLPDVRRT